jgi:hypothetical protein
MMCSVTKKLQVVPGCMDDYKSLSAYHYRSDTIGPLAAIFALKPVSFVPGLPKSGPLGVIVYCLPTPGLAMRNVATAGLFAGLDRRTQLALINKNIRTIARVIIDPRLRCLGLATRLVCETMPQMNVPIIEALAVMGLVNPFFEKAGLTPYIGSTSKDCAQLIEALSLVDIEESDLLDAELVQKKLAALRWPAADFIENQIQKFLQCYGKRRNMSSGLERTRYILSKLTEKPIYYIWFNPKLSLMV